LSIAAIILAAGGSRRLGQPKQLLLHRGETLLARTLRMTQSVTPSPIVVLGASADEIGPTVELSSAHIVENPQWEQGIATSIQAGLRFIEENESAATPTKGVLILTCDQLNLTQEHLARLMEKFVDESGAQQSRVIAASAYAGVTGTPAIFPRALFPNLHALTGDQGARALLHNAQCQIVSVKLPGGELDIDSPEDLANLV
jgi:molybdenum cofactor cytidylyltransferase